MPFVLFSYSFSQYSYSSPHSAYMLIIPAIIRPFSRSAAPATATLNGHTGTVRVVKFRPFDRGGGGDHHSTAVPYIMASAGAGDCAVRVWDVQAGE